VLRCCKGCKAINAAPDGAVFSIEIFFIFAKFSCFLSNCFSNYWLLTKNKTFAKGGTIGLLTGLGGVTGLKKMVEGTPLERALTALTSTSADVEADTQSALDAATDDREDR